MYIFDSFCLIHSYNPSIPICLCFNMVSFRGQKKLGSRPDRSPLGVYFKIPDEHPHPFHMRSPPPPPGLIGCCRICYHFVFHGNMELTYVLPLSFCVEFYNNLSKKQFIYQEKEKSFTIVGATIKTGQHKTKAIDRTNMKSFVRTVSVF